MAVQMLIRHLQKSVRYIQMIMYDVILKIQLKKAIISPMTQHLGKLLS